MAGLLNQRLGCQRQCWIRRWMSRRLRATKKHDCITGVNITACHHDVLTSGHEGHSRIREYGEEGRMPEGLLAPSASQHAPVMLPAYVDFWCQTSPRPTPDPDVSLFIHGPQSGEPDIQV